MMNSYSAGQSEVVLGNALKAIGVSYSLSDKQARRIIDEVLTDN